MLAAVWARVARARSLGPGSLAVLASGERKPMWMFLLWWCVDDHLAAALNAPNLGQLPIWVPAIIAFAFSTTFSLARPQK
jgi:hypothetical protein